MTEEEIGSVKVHETIHGYTQYEWEPDTPEQKAAKEKEKEEWRRTRTAFNIPDCYTSFNYNGVDMNNVHSQADLWETEIEHCNVWRFALKKVSEAPEGKAWDTFMKVDQAYQKYIKTGAHPKEDFDPTLLEREYM